MNRSFPVFAGEISALDDIGAGRVGQRSQPGSAEFGRARLLRTAALGELAEIVVPPAALFSAGRLRPLPDFRELLVSHPVAGLWVARRVDDRRDMPAGGQDEPAVAAEQLIDHGRQSTVHPRGLPARLAMNSTPGRSGSQHRNGPAPTSTRNWSRDAAALACAVAIADLQGEIPMPAWW